MPSYYDSKKKKPGKADMQYNKGGKVEYDKGGKVKKMKGGGRTVARGSGAARPQYFGKNG
tara:strand:+ start:51 stop:230 length:180 start_codon:yes stop_codon:yes gene_type:complete